MSGFLLQKNEKKYWWIEENSTIPCAVTNDGALVMFLLADAKEVLNANYPYRQSEEAWYFNDTLDRQIAELNGERVVCNPQVLWRHFQKVGK